GRVGVGQADNGAARGRRLVQGDGTGARRGGSDTGGIAGQPGDQHRRYQGDGRIGGGAVVGGCDRRALIAAEGRGGDVEARRSGASGHRDRRRDGEGRVGVGQGDGGVARGRRLSQG